MTNSEIKKCNILGVNIAAINMSTLIKYVKDNLKELSGKYICVSNVHTVITAYDDENYMLNHSYGELILRGGRKIGLKANEFRRIDADDALYRNFELNGYDSAFVLSTCDRVDHEKRDVLIMTTKKHRSAPTITELYEFSAPTHEKPIKK